MSQRNIAKNANFPELKVVISPIAVANDSRLKPYSEVFFFSPANIVQQGLGSLFGFFKIRDRSEDSSYIVNFLTSVIKKEYYINPRRSVEDSFDLALNKVNIALSELAKNGNINWMGALDGAVCAIAGSNLYFAATGNARVLLLRDGMLSDISEGLADTGEELHPAKTFVNVSSGILKPSDKLIATSEEIFRVFSTEEIKKNALRFPEEKFIQFINTALVNKLETAETIIVDIKEREKETRKKIKSKEEEESEKNFNAFSAQPYVEKTKQKNRKTEEPEPKTPEFTDEKTGHIYLQEQKEWIAQKGKMAIFGFILKEKMADFWLWLKRSAKKSAFFLWRNIKNAGTSAFRKKEPQAVQPARMEKPPAISKISGLMSRITPGFKNIKSRFVIVLPSFTRIKNIFGRMSYKQKIYGLIIVAVIVIAPLVYLNIKKGNENLPATAPVAPPPALREILAPEKNINLNPAVSVIFEQEKIANIERAGDSLVLINGQKVIERKDDGEIKEYPLPPDAGNATLSTFMKDLNLVFLFTDRNKLISWSPVSYEFKENKIALENNAAIKAIATYLTYLYAVDGVSSRILRYPRAEGGFGEGVSWLKEDLDLSAVKSLAIDENIYLAQENSPVIKLFKGKKQDFNLEQSNTAFKIDKIFTDSGTRNLYVLDGATGRVVRFSKNGEIISQYYNEQFEGARNFSVDEKSNKAYIVASDGKVISLDL